MYLLFLMKFGMYRMVIILWIIFYVISSFNIWVKWFIIGNCLIFIYYIILIFGYSCDYI